MGKIRRMHRRGIGSRWYISKMWRWGPRTVLALLVIDLVYVSTIWPNWSRYNTGAVPKSAFIKHYERTSKARKMPPLDWRQIQQDKIPPHMMRAVVVAEDSRFYQHEGFDLIAFKEAMSFNLDRGRMVFGASTISQQTVKNLLLSASRNPLRKWHELLLTWGMEKNLSKKRILTIYLNIAEFGPGIFGIESAAQHYWNIPASEMDVMQAAELAATLPSPKKHNPSTRTEAFLNRRARILRWLDIGTDS